MALKGIIRANAKYNSLTIASDNLKDNLNGAGTTYFGQHNYLTIYYIHLAIYIATCVSLTMTKNVQEAMLLEGSDAVQVRGVEPMANVVPTCGHVTTAGPTLSTAVAFGLR
jgi:hypothetical protein